jgi:hypothetical protein
VCAACRTRGERAADHFTMCDLASMGTDVGAPGGSAGYFYVVAHRVVYAVPREWAKNVHPGGFKSILNSHARICDVDFGFHSRAAQKKWAAFRSGVLDSCQHPKSPPPLGICTIT